MIQYGHPTRGVVDHGPANGRPKKYGGSTDLPVSKQQRPIRYAATVTTPVRHDGHLRCVRATCCGNTVPQSLPCPTCGQPAWTPKHHLEFGYR